jgi:hypothetical protein
MKSSGLSIMAAHQPKSKKNPEKSSICHPFSLFAKF